MPAGSGRLKGSINKSALNLTTTFRKMITEDDVAYAYQTLMKMMHNDECPEQQMWALEWLRKTHIVSAEKLVDVAIVADEQVRSKEDFDAVMKAIEDLKSDV